jgi:hypothetical protein
MSNDRRGTEVSNETCGCFVDCDNCMDRDECRYPAVLERDAWLQKRNEWLNAENDRKQERITELEKALEDERNQAWEKVLALGKRILERYYPANIFNGSSGDSGPDYIVALRNALGRIDAEEAALKKPVEPV